MLYRVSVTPSLDGPQYDWVVQAPAHYKGEPPAPLLEHARFLARAYLDSAPHVAVVVFEFCPTIVDRHGRVTPAIELELCSFVEHAPRSYSSHPHPHPSDSFSTHTLEM
jgi:hypothetical protein